MSRSSCVVLVPWKSISDLDHQIIVQLTFLTGKIPVPIPACPFSLILPVHASWLWLCHHSFAFSNFPVSLSHLFFNVFSLNFLWFLKFASFMSSIRSDLSGSWDVTDSPFYFPASFLWSWELLLLGSICFGRPCCLMSNPRIIWFSAFHRMTFLLFQRWWKNPFWLSCLCWASFEIHIRKPHFPFSIHIGRAVHSSPHTELLLQPSVPRPVGSQADLPLPWHPSSHPATSISPFERNTYLIIILFHPDMFNGVILHWFFVIWQVYIWGTVW